MRRWVSGLIGILLLVGLFFVPLEGLALEARLALGIFGLAAWYWVTEPIPIYATSLAVILFQVLLLSNEGIPARMGWFEEQAPEYESFFATLAHPIILLFLGGFALARAATKFGLDRTFTHYLIQPFGMRPPAVLAGFICITALLSGFMSNTATTAMMMTVLFPLAGQLPPGDRFRWGLVLSVPFAANIGGMLTPIGTPPNAVVLAALGAQGISISFTGWILLTAPLVFLLLVTLWYGLVRWYPAPESFTFTWDMSGSVEIPGRRAVYIIFFVTILLWVSEAWHGIPSALVALFPVVALTAFRLLEREDIRGLAWEVLWLVAGGIALGVSLRDTGLASYAVGFLPLAGWGILGLAVVIGIAGMLGSNFLSNTVTASLMIPLVISLVGSSDSLGKGTLEPLGLIVACAASLGMALPISTPPNAIATASGLLPTRVMLKAGFVLGSIGLVYLLLVTRVYWMAIF